MLKIFLKSGKLSRSFLIFVCPLGEKFPAWASHSWSRPTRPRTVGEYEYCLLNITSVSTAQSVSCTERSYWTTSSCYWFDLFWFLFFSVLFSPVCSIFFFLFWPFFLAFCNRSICGELFFFTVIIFTSFSFFIVHHHEISPMSEIACIIAELHARALRARGRSPIAKEIYPFQKIW